MNNLEASHDKFDYVYSCDLNDVNFKIKIGTLEGTPSRHDFKALMDDPKLRYSGLYDDKKADLLISCHIYSHGKQLCPPKQTSYKHFVDHWNEWLTFPLKLSDLPKDAKLGITIWDSYGPGKSIPVGGTSLSIFGKHSTFRQGIYDLRIWPGVEADSGDGTPGKCDKGSKSARLNKLKKRYGRGHIPKIDWLDKITFVNIENTTKREKDSHLMYLSIEFPSIQIDNTNHTVVYFETGAEDSCLLSFESDIIVVPDPELLLDNLVEDKHHKLYRSDRTGLTDRDNKPNAQTRNQLNMIVSYPPTKVLTSDEQDLLWKYRFYLMNQKKALTKFLKCVNWDSETEAKQALELLYSWEPMDIEDALELLSPTFQHPAVRQYAVSRLQEAPDEDLILYLLQLVQALKYEDLDVIENDCFKTYKKSLSDLATEPEKESNVSRKMSTTSEVSITPLGCDNLAFDSSDAAIYPSDKMKDMDLATFLIEKAASDDILANFFYWYLVVECEDFYGYCTAGSSSGNPPCKDQKVSNMYNFVLRRFLDRLYAGDREMHRRYNTILRAQSFVDKLVCLMKAVAREKGDRTKKIEVLRSLLSDSSSYHINFKHFEGLPLPLDPKVKIIGILPETATLFKSALMPSQLTFITEDLGRYIAILKIGDDLRQDQLILHTITLIDKLLRRENLDLKLTPYKVLATSCKHGFVQYIESFPVAEVIKNADIQKFFREAAPCENAPYGIQPDVMDTYVKSCAGYCIITYLLGVGDRHLDNLLLTKKGHLFHVDFGYILGRDPKPFPPPMKLSREMVEAMGGVTSDHYQTFRKLCYTAFLHLRRHANLILNLFNLMVDATIPDIALEPDKTVKKVQDKFRLDLNDEEAVHYIQGLIDVSVTAVMAILVEQIHKFAQYWRK
uniref:Phosphatidylinositol 3-kinase catalytic subunit type 3 n=1 Tax=Tetranychus urticae TaxID=32264 RepID=T1KKC8_TETUR